MIDILLIAYLPVALLVIPATFLMLYVMLVWTYLIQRQVKFTEPEPKRPDILTILPPNIVRWYGRNLSKPIIKRRERFFDWLSRYEAKNDMV